MSWLGWAQIALFAALVTAAIRPLGGYMARVIEGGSTPLQRLVRPFETALYRLAGVDPAAEQPWPVYAVGLLAFHLAGILMLYALQRLQGVLPLNPQHFGAVAPDLALNTAVSFASNTSWQSYAGETTLSALTQMAGITVQSFLSAAAGIAVAFALVRGFARRSVATIGNVWVDLTRATLYVLLPICVVAAVFLVWQGAPQTLGGYVHATTLEGAPQLLARGPVASQEAIKLLSGDGGGFFNANSAHPFENPTALAGLAEMLLIFLVGTALTNTFGRMVGDERQGWALFAVMAVMFLAGTAAIYASEATPNPAFAAFHLDQASAGSQSAGGLPAGGSASEVSGNAQTGGESAQQGGGSASAVGGSAQEVGANAQRDGGNMEGKEVRFGVGQSALFAAVSTASSDGAVAAMHDSFMPLSGLVLLANMMLDEVIVGGPGSGLFGMLLFAVVAVFVAGLMIGRTPEYLGKKIEANEIKMTMLVLLTVPAFILVLTSVAAVLPAGLAGLNNAGPHGFSELLYAYTSSAGTNGSAFAGLNANTPFFNLTLALAMFAGRFLVFVPVLCIAGGLAAKHIVPASAGTLQTHGAQFVGLLIGTVVIVGGLTFLPALALGPVAEQFAMQAGMTY